MAVTRETRLTAHIDGTVQGVGFRAWVADHADRLGLRGSARNLPDGRVRVVAEGSYEACEALLTELGDNPPGRVDSVDPEWADPDGEPPGFRTG